MCDGMRSGENKEQVYQRSTLLWASRVFTERGSSLGLLLRPRTFTSTGSISTSSLNQSVSPLISIVGPSESDRLSLGRGRVSLGRLEMRTSFTSFSFSLSLSPESLSSLLVIMFSSRSLEVALWMILQTTYPMSPHRTKMSKIQNSILSLHTFGTYASCPSQARQVSLSEQRAHPAWQLAQTLSVLLVVGQYLLGHWLTHVLASITTYRLLSQTGRHTFPCRQKPAAQERHWVLSPPKQVRQQEWQSLVATISSLMPQKATLGSVWEFMAENLRARYEVLWVRVYSLILTQSVALPVCPLMFSARSVQVQVVMLVTLSQYEPLPQKYLKSKLVAPLESVITSRRQSVSVHAPTQPTLNRMTTAQWFSARPVQFLARQSVLAYFPEKVQLETVMGVGLDEENPARLMDGVLGSSLATMVLWGASEQGVGEDQSAFKLKMLLAHTMHPAVVSLKQAPLQSTQEEEQKWPTTGRASNSRKRANVGKLVMQINNRLQFQYIPSAFNPLSPLIPMNPTLNAEQNQRQLIKGRWQGKHPCQRWAVPVH